MEFLNLFIQKRVLPKSLDLHQKQNFGVLVYKPNDKKIKEDVTTNEQHSELVLQKFNFKEELITQLQKKEEYDAIVIVSKFAEGILKFETNHMLVIQDITKNEQDLYKKNLKLM